MLAGHDPSTRAAGSTQSGPTFAGRLISRTGHGKTAFLDVRDLSGQIQVVVRVDALGQETYDRMLDLDIGDIIAVDGCVYVTKRGQLALAVKEYELLTKALQPPGQAPRPGRHRHALSPSRAGPDGQ